MVTAGLSAEGVSVRRLTSRDLVGMRDLNRLFGREFDDHDTYEASPPADTWLAQCLGKDSTVVLVAEQGGQLIGGLVAYELDKLERERREYYIYDLAVAEQRRRKGVATALILTLQDIARDRDAWVIFVQADYIDPPAIALYEKLGVREEVLHFDIPPAGRA